MTFVFKSAKASPFEGDIDASRVALVRRGQPALPFPHPWNYREPLRILDTFFWNVEHEAGSAKHNRYIDLLGLPYVLVTREPSVIKAILSDSGDKPGQFDRDTSPAEGIARATGEDSLLYANRALWRKQKKVAASPFTRSALFQPDQFLEFEQTFRHTAVNRIERFRERLAHHGGDCLRLAIEQEVQVVMLEMLVTNFFGGSVEYDELWDKFVPAITRLIDYMVADTVIPRSRNILRYYGKRGKALRRDKEILHELTEIALSGRLKGAGLWPRFRSDAPNDALRSNIRVFLAGALEATTSYATWALSHLSHSEELQECIFQEVGHLESYTPENLENAKTLNRVLEETLRLTPSLYFLPRRASEDRWIKTDDGRSMRIPAGTHLVLDIWHANRCEEFWGIEQSGFPADEFHPQRWEILESRNKRIKDVLHFGFGYGPRVCPGKFLGVLEVALVVGAVVKLFKFRAVNPKTQAKAGVSTKPADGVLVDLHLR